MHPFKQYALSFDHSETLQGERVRIYRWVPIGPNQMAGQILSADGAPHPPGKVTFSISGGGTQDLVSLGNGYYRDLTSKEK